MVFGTYISGEILVAYGTERLGHFDPPQFLQAADNSLNVGKKYIDPLMHDFDGDGDLDLTVGHEDGIVLYENVGAKDDPHFEAKPRAYKFGGELPSPSEFGAKYSPDLCDWDNDGHLDIIFGCDNGSIWWCQGNKDSVKALSFGKPMRLLPYSPLLPGAGSHYVAAKTTKGAKAPARSAACARIATVDWNGDGKLEVVSGEKYTVIDPTKKRKIEFVRGDKQVEHMVAVQTSCGGIWIYPRK